MPTHAESDQTSYRVIFVDEDGKVSLTLLLFAAGDSEAKRKAKAMVDGHGVDLWEGLRFIEHFPPIEPQA